MGWYILGVIIALVISAIIAACFADVAREKGFEESHYFWLCFIFGIAGYLLVVALPDRKIRTAPFKPEMKTASANQFLRSRCPNKMFQMDKKPVGRVVMYNRKATSAVQTVAKYYSENYGAGFPAPFLYASQRDKYL